LTDEHNVGLFRQWENADPTYLHILRFIRICGEYPDVMHITRPGRDGAKRGTLKEREVDEIDIGLGLKEEATVEISRVGSHMLTMDEIPFS